LIVSQESLKEFLNDRAQVWERQFYLKARSIGELLPFSPSQICSQRGLNSDDLKSLHSIRKKLIRPFEDNRTDIKYNPGGLVDIELALQAVILHNRLTARGPSVVDMNHCIQNLKPEWRQSCQILQSNYTELRIAEQMLQLASNHSGSKINYGVPEGERLAHLLASKTSYLHKRLTHLMFQSATILKDIDPIQAARQP